MKAEKNSEEEEDEEDEEDEKDEEDEGKWKGRKLRKENSKCKLEFKISGLESFSKGAKSNQRRFTLRPNWSS